MSETSILFTASDSILSRAIRDVTGEPVSHCAIRASGFVIHFNLLGLRVESWEEFCGHSLVLFEVPVQDNWPALIAMIDHGFHAWYDFPGLLFDGMVMWARSHLPKWAPLPDSNLWQMSGMYLCTEFVTEFLNGKPDSSVTPYQLYQALSRR